MKIPKTNCAYDEMREVVNLVPHPQNPNTHTKIQIKLLSKIIEHQGWRNPVVVSKNSGYIVAGHGRLLAAQQLGLSEVPCDIQEFETEADELAHLVADNRIAELAEINRSALADIVGELDNGEFDLELTGFELDDFEELMTAAPPEGEIEGDIKFSERLGEANNYIVLKFDNELDWLSAQTHFELDSVYSKRANGKPWSKGIGRVLDGADYLNKANKI